jgi:hypothetical protein
MRDIARAQLAAKTEFGTHSTLRICEKRSRLAPVECCKIGMIAAIQVKSPSPETRKSSVLKGSHLPAHRVRAE